AQKRPGFEADRWQLMVVEVDGGGAFRGGPRSITPEFDRWPDSFAWDYDGQALYFTPEEKATTPIFFPRPDGGKVTKCREGGTTAARTTSRRGGDLVFTEAALAHPPEVFAYRGWLKASDAVNPPFLNLSRANAKLLAGLDLPRPENVTVP